MHNNAMQADKNEPYRSDREQNFGKTTQLCFTFSGATQHLNRHNFSLTLTLFTPLTHNDNNNKVEVQKVNETPMMHKRKKKKKGHGACWDGEGGRQIRLESRWYRAQNGKCERHAQ